MSKDADILGDRELVEKLAKTPGWKVKYYHEPRQTAVALLWKESLGEDDLIVEVLRTVRGLGPKDVTDSDEIELEPGKVYRLPSPIRMMKAKVANLAEIRPMREQDLRHVRLLIPICRHYLNDQLQNVRSGQMSERQWINAYHELHEIVATRAAQTLDKKFELGLDKVFPVAASAEGLPKIAKLCPHLQSPREKPSRSRICAGRTQAAVARSTGASRAAQRTRQERRGVARVSVFSRPATSRTSFRSDDRIMASRAAFLSEVSIVWLSRKREFET